MNAVKLWKRLDALGERKRMLLTAGANFLIDLLYALYHGALGLREGSPWFLTLCAYYTLLGAVRFGAVLCGRRENPLPKTEAFVTRLSGGLLMLLSLVLAGVSYLSLTYGMATRHDIILMITIATYTFTKLGMAIVRAIRYRKNPALLPAVIRCVGYAELAASIYTMQRSMIVSFDEMPGQGMLILDAFTGGAVFLFVLLLGVGLIHKANRKD
ncbi:MAG: hypothetical protein K2F83_03200 [Oscillospiraceae bacterium]|nr:hypothetical protein [Oscillospiraceae bacterium]